jgi:hypothetical protein
MFSNNKAKIIILTYIYFTPFLLFSWGPTTESYLIRNDSNETIYFIVSCTDELHIFSEIPYFENGILIDFIKMYVPIETNTMYIVEPNNFEKIVEVIKNTSIGMLDKFHRLFDGFAVCDSEGNLIMTIEDISENSFSVRGDIMNIYAMTRYDLHITQEMVEVGRQKYAEFQYQEGNDANQ